jgi:hypothetical protein
MSTGKKAVKRTRRTRAQILHLLKVFEQSGTSASVFCSSRGIQVKNFYKWQQRYSSQRPRSGFVPVEVTPAAVVESTLFAEVNGIKLFQSVPASFLKELLA